MDRYYSRLHNLIPWDQLLHTQIVPGLHELVNERGQPLDEACPLGAALGPEVAWQPQPRAKPDGRGEGNEAQATHQEELSALFIVHDMFWTPKCPRCKYNIEREAAYWCMGCVKEFHVRCLRKVQDTHTQTQIALDRRQYIHFPYCCWCGTKSRQPTEGSHSPARGLPLVEDPMGVCT